MANKIYQIVTLQGAQYFNEQDLVNHFEVTGFNENPSVRKELQGEYRLKGLLGPMYNGVQDDKVVIRYESQEAYELYSN